MTLPSSRLAWRLEVHDELPSTSDLVRVRMLSEMPEKLVISQIRRATSGPISAPTPRPA